LIVINVQHCLTTEREVSASAEAIFSAGLAFLPDQPPTTVYDAQI